LFRLSRNVQCFGRCPRGVKISHVSPYGLSFYLIKNTSHRHFIEKEIPSKKKERRKLADTLKESSDKGLKPETIVIFAHQ